jgi:hypothetical protein
MSYKYNVPYGECLNGDVMYEKRLESLEDGLGRMSRSGGVEIDILVASAADFSGQRQIRGFYPLAKLITIQDRYS